MLSVTKKFEFESAHFLDNYDGKCANMHGHTFKLEVEICRSMRPTQKQFYKNSDMIIDFGDLKKIVNEQIIDKVDHKVLNGLFDFNPTSENLVEWIVDRLIGIFGSQLVRVRLYETTNSYAEWKP